jgi:Contractile injection system tube protein
MLDPIKLQKAELIELTSDFKTEKSGGKRVPVQFNPDSLKVSFANQIETPSGPGSQKGTAGALHIGSRTTKMALQLWFDVTRSEEPGQAAQNVRKLTEEVLYFIRPKPPEGQNAKNLVPPAVRFHWGTFHFDGIVEAAEETLDYWSNDGRPLRSSISLTLSQQEIEVFSAGTREAKARQIAGLLSQEGNPAAGRPAGTTPMAQASAGTTVQGMADISGGDWQSVAAANGIETPRFLQPGQLLNLNPVVRTPAF